jgi:hypothetical protein
MDYPLEVSGCTPNHSTKVQQTFTTQLVKMQEPVTCSTKPTPRYDILHQRAKLE